MFDPAFRKYLEEAVGAEAAGKAVAALSEEASVSLRLNPFKTGTPPFAPARRIRWSPCGYLLRERPLFTEDPLFHAGAYYVQDSSAMFAGHLFRLLLPEADRPLRALDLCAAPGGKTTDLAASLRAHCGERFFLVANEPIRQRAETLRDNVAVWGDPHVAVTGADPRAFAALEGFFDILLTDVPCSGEGMFRKEAKAVEDWSEETVRLCAARQRRIVADAWPALAPGGILLYATCTFNRYENDGNVKWIASELGAEILQIAHGCPEVLSTETGFCLIPGRVPGEGQFVAALRKTGGRQAAPLPSLQHRSSNSQKISGLLDFEAAWTTQGDTLVAIPSAIAAETEAVRPLRLLSCGVRAGALKGGTFVPHEDLALSLFLHEGRFPAAEVSRETALQYLHGDAFALPEAPKGFVLLKYRGIPFGFVKNLGSRCNNLHPHRRRIRMPISPSHTAPRS